MFDEKQRLKNIIELGQEITQVKDIDILLERILAVARRFVNADAGSIYVKENDRLRFISAQNDTLKKRLAPGKKLIYSSFTIPVDMSSIAGYVAYTGEMLAITDVYDLPKGLPYSFNKEYDRVSDYHTQSMLTVPLKLTRRGIIGVMQLINAKDDSGNVYSFLKEDEPFITHFAGSAALAVEHAAMTRDMILRMIKMAELRDPKETGPHVNRVAAYSVEIYETWAARRGMPADEMERNKDVLRMAAMLHDVGKVAISDAILKKPAKLDPDEIIVMRQHTYLGSRLFSEHYSEFDEASSIVAMNHHEKWDGTGYPGYIDAATGRPLPGYELKDGGARGKKAEETPPFGRVVAIADVYDALSCRRVYKEPWGEDRVLETLKSDSGKHFDPEMIDAFFASLDTIRSVAKRYPENE
ncbi:MAG: HD domain-containing protein [Nitrospirae bacterium]|nr:HD domain-containing protein [Nitrospirota bacterium]